MEKGLKNFAEYLPKMSVSELEKMVQVAFLPLLIFPQRASSAEVLETEEEGLPGPEQRWEPWRHLLLVQVEIVLTHEVVAHQAPSVWHRRNHRVQQDHEEHVPGKGQQQVRQDPGA